MLSILLAVASLWGLVMAYDHMATDKELEASLVSVKKAFDQQRVMDKIRYLEFRVAYTQQILRNDPHDNHAKMELNSYKEQLRRAKEELEKLWRK